jgi:hypothetical protein
MKRGSTEQLQHALEEQAYHQKRRNQVFDLRVTVHTGNADFALAQVQERLAFMLDSLAKELRVAGLQLEGKSPNS